MRLFALPLLLLAAMVTEPRPRIRDLGVTPGIFSPGQWNAITDVEGVRVGHRTLVRGESVRTGVTAILPHGGNLFQEKVPAAWLSTQLGGPIAVLPALLCIALVVLFAMLITEVTSNTASAALLVPLFVGLAPHVDQVAVAVLVAAGASCAFLLPVATPPNAIVFGSGHVPQRSMIRSGLALSAFALPVLVAAGALALVLR